MSQDGDSGSDSCGSRYHSEETGGGSAAVRRDNFVFKRSRVMVTPVDSGSSEEEAAVATSGQKRQKKPKRSKGKSSGKEWKHHVVWDEEGKGSERNRTTFPNAEGVADLPPWFCVKATRGGVKRVTPVGR